METLGAEVRVKNGLVGLSGSASFGNSGVVNGGSVKSNIDGSYVSAGYTGNQGASSVYSDNGTGNGYDLGSLGITYPLISGIGADKYMDSSGVIWATQENFLDARSLNVPVATVTSATTSFTYGPDAYGNKVTFVKAGNKGVPPATLTLKGIIKVPAAFQLGSKDTIKTDGNGTIYCPGTMKIDGNLLPVDGKIFPTTTRIGLIAKQDLLLATGNGSAQLSLAGAFYAQGQVKSAKQNQIMGTLVGSYYDLGTNVPSIYQVPTLAKNLPPGMPGDKPYITLKLQSWRVRKMAN